jgi:hypothetical protein
MTELTSAKLSPVTRLTVLMYHAIADVRDEGADPHHTVEIGRFELQLGMLRDNGLKPSSVRDGLFDKGGTNAGVVLPSFREGLSNALLEAMASGLPVIASAVGGNPEVVQHEHNGLLFEADQADQLANAIARLVNDLSLATALGSRARQDVARRFSVCTMIHQFEAL